MRQSPLRGTGRRPARAMLLGATTLTLTLGLAGAAQAAEEGESSDDGGNLGPIAAAVVGVGLGVAGFALSESGEGEYPEEHH